MKKLNLSFFLQKTLDIFTILCYNNHIKDERMMFMLEVMEIQEVAEELMKSKVGNYMDSFNYILILGKEKEGGFLNSYQMCIQRMDYGKELYVSEYDLFSDEVGRTYDIEDFKKCIENQEVYVISEIEKI